MPATIEGQVAAILNESFLVINLGTAKGAREGMVFVVLAEGADVKDPANGQSLGRWELPKGFVRVVHAQPAMATCQAFDPAQRSAAEQGDRSTQTLSATMIADSVETRHALPKLNVRRADIVGMPEIGPIRVGDRVSLVSEP